MSAGGGPWRLRGYDTFAGEWYPLAGEYPTETAARQAAAAELRDREEEQPTAQSGGQHPGGIQDRLFVVRPNGSVYRYLPGD